MKIIALLALALIGCAVRPACRNCVYQHNITVRFEKKDCRDLPGGKFSCKFVVFDPQTINAHGSR